MTQLSLAEKLSKPQSFVSKYERQERRLDVAEFIAIARALRMKPGILLARIEKAIAVL